MPLHQNRPHATQTGGKPAGQRLAAGNAAARGMADWLCLAAAPTFAAMAVLTAAFGGTDMTCMAMQGAFPLGGMVPMYLLMSAFHLAPWLKLAAGRRPLAG